jgi:hypothetical protein
MKCAIMQPTYLPWTGYFNLLANVERFVFLDDVQFERRSWQSRNRILQQGKELYLTVPVRKAERDDSIHAIHVDDSQDWRARHLASLRHAYARAPHGAEIIDAIASVFARNDERLADLNRNLIAAIARLLGIETVTANASALGCAGKRSEHLAAICRAVQCDAYLSPQGSRDYLLADRFAETSGLRLSFQEYAPAPYAQPGAEQFVSHLSIVDVIAHGGREFASTYVRNGSPA